MSDPWFHEDGPGEEDEEDEDVDPTDLREAETEADNWYDQTHKSGD